MTNPVLCEVTQNDFYIGPAGAIIKMIQPDEYYTNNLDQAFAPHALVGGGNSVQHGSKTRRKYGLTYTARLQEDADQILTVFGGHMGPGPYYFVDPLWRNVLASPLSNANGRLQNTVGFIPAGGGTVSFDATTVPPNPPQSGIRPGCQAWIPVLNSVLYVGASAATILDTTAIPVIPSLPITVYAEMRAGTGTASIGLQVYYNDINGAYISSVNLTTCAVLSSGWTRFSGTVAAGAAPANAVTAGVRLLCNTTSPPTVYVTKFGASYLTATVGGTGLNLLQPWVLGYEVPKVLVASGSPSNHSKSARRRTLVLDLVEV